MKCPPIGTRVYYRGRKTQTLSLVLNDPLDGGNAIVLFIAGEAKPVPLAEITPDLEPTGLLFADLRRRR